MLKMYKYILQREVVIKETVPYQAEENLAFDTNINCKLGEGFTVLQKIVEVEKIGEDSGFFREYYRDILDTKRVFARQEDFKNIFNWYTTTVSWGEPDHKIGDEIEFIIVPKSKRGGRVKNV